MKQCIRENRSIDIFITLLYIYIYNQESENMTYTYMCTDGLDNLQKPISE